MPAAAARTQQGAAPGALCGSGRLAAALRLQAAALGHARELRARVGRVERQRRVLMATCSARAWPPPSAERAPPESAGRRLMRRMRAADGALMRLCRSFRRRRVRPNRARLRRWVLQWCLLVACKQGKIQS